MVCPKAPQPSLGLAEIRPHFGPPESSRCTPTLSLCLIPYLEQGNSSLQVQLSTRVPYVGADAQLMSMPLMYGNTPTTNYSSENPIRAFDAFGSFPLYYEDRNDMAEPFRVWFPKRAVTGYLKLVFTAYPGATRGVGVVRELIFEKTKVGSLEVLQHSCHGLNPLNLMFNLISTRAGIYRKLPRIQKLPGPGVTASRHAMWGPWKA
jgi:hypothetical protein